VARALGIPVVGEIVNATALVQAGDAVIVDGQAGEVQIRPQPDVENAYKDKARLRARKQKQYEKLKELPAVTKDGVEITLQINAGLLVDMPNLDATAASGIAPSCSSWSPSTCRRRPSSRRSMPPCSMLRRTGR
jgi:phosphotransferase system enzyme I (PtsP)